MEATVSIRAFAKMVGLSDMAARKAIKSGNIKKGVTYNQSGDPCIYPTVAAREWGKDIIPTGNEAPETDAQDEADAANYADGIPDSTSKSEADRMIAVYKAKKARLEFLETEGNLVDKGLVYSLLYDFAGEVKSDLMNVPDRIIDAVLAAEGRNAALILLGNELSSALDRLSKTDELQILDKR
jgi:hypothetical protein